VAPLSSNRKKQLVKRTETDGKGNKEIFKNALRETRNFHFLVQNRDFCSCWLDGTWTGARSPAFPNISQTARCTREINLGMGMRMGWLPCFA